jgi:cell division protein YceG involved in septum cleavage
MEAKKMRKILFLLVMLVVIVMITFLLTRYAREETALSIPAGMEVTRLSDILENPSDFDNKRVLLEGTVGAGCLACPGDFPYQEGVNSIKILTEDFRRPRLRHGQPIRIYAEVKAGEERPVISALAMEVR